MSINSSVEIQILIQMALEYKPVRIHFFVSRPSCGSVQKQTSTFIVGRRFELPF